MLLESIGDAVCGLDRHGRRTFISTVAAQVLSCAPDELLGQDIHERLHHSPSAGLPCAQRECVVSRVLHTGCEGRATDAVVRRRD